VPQLLVDTLPLPIQDLAWSQSSRIRYILLRLPRAVATYPGFPVVPSRPAKKGKRSAADQTHEGDPEFIRLPRRHSAVESAIHALEVPSLDRCPDHGLPPRIQVLCRPGRRGTQHSTSRRNTLRAGARTRAAKMRSLQKSRLSSAFPLPPSRSTGVVRLKSVAKAICSHSIPSYDDSHKNSMK